MWVLSLTFKSGTRFWLKFGASQGHETFIESKCKGCYTIEDFLLSKDV